MAMEDRFSIHWRTRRDLRGAVYATFVSLAVFLTLASSIFVGSGDALDRRLVVDASFLRQPALTPWMIAASFLADWRLLIPCWILTFLVARARRVELGDIVLLLMVLSSSWILGYALKGAFARPRPSVPPPLIQEPYYSFPSGHAITAFCFFGFLAYLAWVRFPDWPRRILVGLTFVAVFVVVGFSRVYLGVHFVGDVLGGFVAGVPILAAGITAHRFGYRPLTGFHGGKPGAPDPAGYSQDGNKTEARFMVR